MKRIALMVGAAMLLGVTQLIAQAKPSFAGTWTLVPDTAAAAAAAGGGARGGGRGGGLGQTVTIAQDAATLTTTSTSPAGEVKSVYKLDGTDSKNSRTMGARAGGTATPIETVSQAKWDANKLVITTNINFNGTAVSTTMSLSLDASGQLIVESTGIGRQGAAATANKATYKKG